MKYPKHVLQSLAWGEFRTAWKTKVVKAGKVQFTVHPIPCLSYTIGYMPRPFPEDINWKLLVDTAKKERCVFIKIEPNSDTFTPPKGFNIKRGNRMFAYATFLIDLTKTEKELLENMHQKTRYNIRLAEKKGVVVKTGNSKEMLQEFLSLQRQTVERQRFFLHPDTYYKTLFSVFLKHDMVHIVTGYVDTMPVASMMLFSYNKTLFYPYGGTSNLHREKMAPHLVFWETIRLGKKLGCTNFDLWNCLHPEEEVPTHPWFGFHKFKKGFGGQLINFCGAYDLVLIPWLYPLLNLANTLRWTTLRLNLFLKNVTKRNNS